MRSPREYRIRAAGSRPLARATSSLSAPSIPPTEQSIGGPTPLQRRLAEICDRLTACALLLALSFPAMAAASDTIRLSGSLIDSEGRAVELPLLIAEEGALSADADEDLLGAPATSRFEAELPPGRYVVEIALSSGSIVRRPLGPLVQDTQLEPWVPPKGRYRGLRIVDGEGKPVPRARVHVVSRWGGEPLPQFFGRMYSVRRILESVAEHTVLTNADGRCRVWLAEEASHRVGVTAPGKAPLWEKLRPDGSATLQLEAARPLRIRVESAQKSPLPQARFDLGGTVVAQSDSDGYATLPFGNEPLLYRVSSPGHSSGREIDSETSIVRLDPSLTIRGNVIDRDRGTAIPHAVVWPRGRPEDWRRADGKGRFEIDTRSAAQPLDVVAVAAGYDQGDAKSFGERSTPIALARTCAATITVLAPDGTRISGANVEVRPTAWRSRSVKTSVSGSEGKTTVEGLVPGSYRVRATHPDFAVATVPLTLAADDLRPTLTVVLRDGLRGKGRVVDAEERPLEGTTITLSKLMQPRGRRLLFEERAVAETVSDGNGDFQTGALAPGRYEVLFEHEGFARRQAMVDLVEAEEQGLGTFRLERGQRLPVRVLTMDDEPIAGAEVSVTDQGPGGPGRWKRVSAQTDAQGGRTFEGLSAGAHQIVVKAESYATTFERRELPIEGELVVRLHEGLLVRGRVESSEGTPLVARVALVSGAKGYGRFHGGAWVVAEQGRFELPPVRPQEGLRIAFDADGFQGKTMPLAGSEEAQTLEIDVVLEEGISLEGQVLDESGQPIPGARVSADSDARASDVLRNPVTSDVSGRFMLTGLKNAEYRVSVEADGFLPVRRQVGVRAGSDETFTLSRGFSVSGRVIDDRGDPVEGAVWIQRHSAGLKSWHSVMRVQDPPTDRDGRFVVDALGPGYLQIEVEKEGFAKGSSTVLELVDRDIEGVEIELSRGFTVRGRITGLSENELAEAKLTAHGMQGTDANFAHFGRVSVAEDGSFLLEETAPGLWQLRASVESTRRFVKQQIDVDGDLTGIELAFDDTVEVRGTVELDGSPAPGATVRVLGASGENVTTADAQGRFEVEAPSGTVDLVVTAGGARHLERLDLLSDVDLEIELTSHRLTVLVEDADGRPVAGAGLWTLDSRGGTPRRESGTSTDGTADILLPERPPGPIQVLARHRDKGTGRVVLPEGETGAVIVLEPHASTRVRLVETDGRAPTIGQIFLQGNGFSVETLDVEASQPAELKVPPGRYLLWGQSWRSQAGPRWVELPRDEITLQLELGGFVRLTGRSASGWDSIVGRHAGQAHPAVGHFGHQDGQRSGPLAPGRWTLEVTDLVDGTTRQIAVDVVAGETIDVEIP